MLNHTVKRTPGIEQGTYAYNGSGYVGSDCFASFIGAAKFLPNVAGTGGTICAKANIQYEGAGPLCASLIGSGADKQLSVLSGRYTYNHDGTLCENLKVVGGIFDGQNLTFHDYVSPKGDLIILDNININYPCPVVTPAQTPLATVGSTTLFKISKVGDDPPGSATLNCTNP